MATDPADNDLRLTRKELVINERFEVLSILNDGFIAVFFISGSIMFFNDSTAYAGSWLFLLGSIEMLIRPVIRLSRRARLRQLGPRVGSVDAGGGEY